jgi:hypothetical protein
MPEDLAGLSNGQLHRFADWPNAVVPRHAAGVYTIWRGSQLVYARVAGRGQTAQTIA